MTRSSRTRFRAACSTSRFAPRARASTMAAISGAVSLKEQRLSSHTASAATSRSFSTSSSRSAGTGGSENRRIATTNVLFLRSAMARVAWTSASALARTLVAAKTATWPPSAVNVRPTTSPRVKARCSCDDNDTHGLSICNGSEAMAAAISRTAPAKLLVTLSKKATFVPWCTCEIRPDPHRRAGCRDRKFPHGREVFRVVSAGPRRRDAPPAAARSMQSGATNTPWLNPLSNSDRSAN